jgi:hypothetical protein
MAVGESGSGQREKDNLSKGLGDCRSIGYTEAIGRKDIEFFKDKSDRLPIGIILVGGKNEEISKIGAIRSGREGFDRYSRSTAPHPDADQYVGLPGIGDTVLRR